MIRWMEKGFGSTQGSVGRWKEALGIAGAAIVLMGAGAGAALFVVGGDQGVRAAVDSVKTDVREVKAEIDSLGVIVVAPSYGPAVDELERRYSSIDARLNGIDSTLIKTATQVDLLVRTLAR